MTGGFILLAALFFILRFGHFARWASPYAMPLPVLFLALCTLGYRRAPDWIFTALMLSSLGDTAGSTGNFLWQIAFFAAAHVCYTMYFVRDFRFRKRAMPLFFAELAAVAVLFHVIVPKTDAMQRPFVILYIIVITIMAAAAIFRDGRRYVPYVVAALVFVASDSVIAWNRFVERIPNAAAYIMSTYYAAQLAFAVTSLGEQAE